jgi:lipoyl(octanoyl) transferase
VKSHGFLLFIVTQPMKTICEYFDLGHVPYDDAWALQDRFAAEIARGERLPALLLLEHSHVYTFGRRGQEQNLLLSEAQLAERGLTIRWVDRGGDVTYHGPGQLVGYPLLALGRVDQNNHLSEVDYTGYLRRLEKILIKTLASFGLASGQVPGLTGVWIQPDVYSRCVRCRPEDRQKPAKIAAIGVKVDANGITRHGFALNVNPDMTYFDGIRPCGLTEPVASMADLLDPVPSMDEVKQAVIEAFGSVFETEISRQDDFSV